MQVLLKAFIRAIVEKAKEHGFEDQLELYELAIAGEFLISEIFSIATEGNERHRAVLDEFHKQVAYGILNTNLSHFIETSGARNKDEAVDYFLKSFHQRTIQRYKEYRQVWNELSLSERSLNVFDPFMNSILEHTLESSNNVGEKLFRFEGATLMLRFTALCKKDLG